MKLKLDLEKESKHFFDLPDWKSRAAILGGIGTVIYAFMFGIYFFVFIFFLFPLSLVVILGMMFGLMLVVGFFYHLYVLGYQQELIDKYKTTDDVSQVLPLANYNGRVKEGFKIYLLLLIYNLPTLIFMVFILIGIILPEYVLTETSAFEGFYILFMMLYFVSIAVFVIYTFFVSYVLIPLARAEYSNTKKLSSFVSYSRLKNLVKNYYKESIYIILIYFIVTQIVYFIIYFAFGMIFLCIGIIAFPIISAIGITYMQHFQARLYAKLANVIQENG